MYKLFSHDINWCPGKSNHVIYCLESKAGSEASMTLLCLTMQTRGRSYEHGSSNIVGIEEPFRLNVVCPLRIPLYCITFAWRAIPREPWKNIKTRKTTARLVTKSTASNLRVRVTRPLLLSARDYSFIAHHWKRLEKNSGHRSPGIEGEGSTIVY